jgi:hypothetical protein
MNTVFVMILVAYSGGLSGGVAMEKVGLFESRAACEIAAESAGFKKELDLHGSVMYHCVASPDGFGAE